jgi:glutathione S-transferase
MSLTLYHNDMSVCSAKVRMALAEKKLLWDGIHLDLRAGDAQRPEYVKLNPNQVVPTLLHNGAAVIESNLICEYLDDAFPETPLRPADALARARMRLWMKQLDDGIHAATQTISTCIAFRHQHLKRRPEDLREWLDNMVDPARRERTKLAIELGTDSPDFGRAVLRFERLLDDMERVLAVGSWLAGDTYSLADVAYAPYLIRLEHLGFGDRVAARPRSAEWAHRLMARSAFQEGIGRWLNPKYLTLFEAYRDAARSHINRIAST